DFCQLVVYALFHRRSPWGSRSCLVSTFYLFQERLAIFIFQPQTRVKLKAKRDYGRIEGVQGFGIGDGAVRIYIRDESVKSKLPSKIGDTRVEAILLGRVVAAPAEGKAGS
ncbi:MAG: hypothetical protein SF339_23110, partial [Blastocatellia bacterium]|nr:hypothetical protein [Blastocatellia bacterium]